MASSVKGIIVEIGGDTSGLQKALSKVNSATSSLSKELRGVNSLLKLDPKNTELLAQKQNILSNSIEETENKLKLLHSTYQKGVEAEVEGAKISEDNWRALQREIINTENKLKNLKLETSNWTNAGRKIEKIGTKMENLGDRVDNLGNKLTTRITAPLVALGIVGVKSAAEQETAMQQVELIYGEASETIKDFAENTSISYNMSTKEAYKYSQIYGNLIQSITDDEEENARYTQELLKASAVIASSTGRTMEDVMDRIRSGLLGNTEAIEDLGVNVNVALLESTDAFKQFAGDKSWEQLDFQTQQQIRLFGILEQSTKKYGNEINDNTASSIQKLTAKFNNMTSKLNKKLLPVANKLIDKADKLMDKIGDLTDEETENIIKTGLMVAAAGPLVKILGTTTKTIGGTVKGIGLFTQAIGVMRTGAQSSSTAVNNIAKVLSTLSNPASLAAIGVTAAVGIIVAQVKKAEEQTKQSLANVGQSAVDFVTGIDSATSHLNSFNSILFASSAEQEELQKNMDEVQQGITNICKTASEERRNYTQEEITQLDKYFQKLRELNQREIEIQQAIASAITQQATTNAEAFQGSLEEYKLQSQEWIKTAEEQKNKTIELINTQTIEEVALLNQRYGEEANMQNKAYVNEYNKIIKNKENKITAATDEVAKISEIYARGYLQRSQQEEGFFSVIQQYNSQVEEENTRHSDRMKQIDDYYINNVIGQNMQEGSELKIHKKRMKEIWEKMYKDMDENQEKQLGVWIAQVAQTELYGGQIDDETKKIVDAIIESYDSMPLKTKETMNETMNGMLKGMQEKEPTLFEKATGIANGVLNRLKKAFDIHSPSKETEAIFEDVMGGSERGIENEKNKLYKQIDSISQGVLAKFNALGSDINLGAFNQSVIDKTKTIFTTPQIVFNVQELDDAKLQQCFNYINRKFGSAY